MKAFNETRVGNYEFPVATAIDWILNLQSESSKTFLPDFGQPVEPTNRKVSHSVKNFDTVGIQKTDLSGIIMVRSKPVLKWSSFRVVINFTVAARKPNVFQFCMVDGVWFVIPTIQKPNLVSLHHFISKYFFLYITV